MFQPLVATAIMGLVYFYNFRMTMSRCVITLLMFWAIYKRFASELNIVLTFLELCTLKLRMRVTHKLQQLMNFTPKHQGFCITSLLETSPSFSFVTLQLPAQLRLPVAIFYLVIRTLNTIEDDMTLDADVKKNELLKFADHLQTSKLNEAEYTGNQFKFIAGGSSVDEVRLLGNFPLLLEAFHSLKVEQKIIIAKSTRKMAEGMGEFITKQVESLNDYNEYCYYVAGVVGAGLSEIFKGEGHTFLCQDEEVTRLSIAMGRFLQKVNIIRDYHEDINQSQPRIFYPAEIWKKHSKNIKDVQKKAFEVNGIRCINELVVDALSHIPDCLSYLALLEDPEVFRFCAILQCLAFATLAACFSNAKVFSSLLNVPEMEAVAIFANCNDYRSAVFFFDRYLKQIKRSMPSDTDRLVANQILEAMETVNQAKHRLEKE